MTPVAILGDKEQFFTNKRVFPAKAHLFRISEMINKKKPHLRRGRYESTTDLKETSLYLISASAAVAVAGLITVDRR
jgi:hypothetical protein